jgi:small subunit ribosomal protein S15
VWAWGGLSWRTQTQTILVTGGRKFGGQTRTSTPQFCSLVSFSYISPSLFSGAAARANELSAPFLLASTTLNGTQPCSEVSQGEVFCILIIHSSIFAHLDRLNSTVFTRLEDTFAQPISCSSRASFHSSASTHESARQRESRLQKKAAQARREALARGRIADAPHPCLGHRPGKEQLWIKSDLRNTILTSEKILSTPSARAGEDDVVLPRNYQYGVGPREQRLLMEDLPTVRMQQQTSQLDPFQSDFREDATRAFHVEMKSKGQMAILLDLKNADAGGVAFENRRRIIEVFGEPGKKNDSGRTEVQGTSALCVSTYEC